MSIKNIKNQKKPYPKYNREYGLVLIGFEHTLSAKKANPILRKVARAIPTTWLEVLFYRLVEHTGLEILENDELKHLHEQCNELEKVYHLKIPTVTYRPTNHYRQLKKLHEDFDENKILSWQDLQDLYPSFATLPTNHYRQIQALHKEEILSWQDLQDLYPSFALKNELPTHFTHKATLNDKVNQYIKEVRELVASSENINPYGNMSHSEFIDLWQKAEVAKILTNQNQQLLNYAHRK